MINREGAAPMKGRPGGFWVTTKPYQRRGVAAALLAYSKKSHRSLTAKTKPDNNRTIKLLEREGVSLTARTTGDISHGVVRAREGLKPLGRNHARVRCATARSAGRRPAMAELPQ
jgi:hypothetical protein